ncbi:M20/M25/M40 family metallo-hydrolase [Methylocapsa sp. S129]|uniref:M20/M25/M40 family metallo-hydrolase n=1 Tax=Methylocapsa sp. S129 TaxID=1641869 RepID=UPI001FEDFF09|nr:M20/M25/M40 family metallo-hydrolase [Methylocapsa sp. S129]
MMTRADPNPNRQALAAEARANRRGVVDIALKLLGIPSPNPPGDTRAIAAAMLDLLNAMPGVTAERHASGEGIHNVVARLKGAGNGPRLIFNGHLDTFPLGDLQEWTASTTGAEIGGRIYGLGVSDMKGGLAASLFALQSLAAARSDWRGEIVATFAGDEETMGRLGTQFLLDHVAHAHGDAVICADAGSPRVLRIGEKGLIWLRLKAKGRSAHAAHVHRGDSAIDKLVAAMAGIAALRDFAVRAPAEVLETIAAASAVSEALSGVGESDVLRKVTVTFGTIKGGRLPNLVPDAAEATADIRLPLGVNVSEIKDWIARQIVGLEGVAVEWIQSYEPSWTDPESPIVGIMAACVREAMGVEPVVNMRVGASDARLYRAAAHPVVVCGLTPNAMGAADEFVEAEELMGLAEALTLAAFDFFGREEERR